MFTKNNDLWDECFKDFDEDTYCGLTVSELTDIYIEWLQAVVEENNTYFVDSKCLPGTTVIGNTHENKGLLNNSESKVLQEAAIYGLSIANKQFKKE